ncbi:hypothetical protein Tco_1490716 [Tanacetum coccineum]
MVPSALIKKRALTLLNDGRGRTSSQTGRHRTINVGIIGHWRYYGVLTCGIERHLRNRVYTPTFPTGEIAYTSQSQPGTMGAVLERDIILRCELYEVSSSVFLIVNHEIAAIPYIGQVVPDTTFSGMGNTCPPLFLSSGRDANLMSCVLLPYQNYEAASCKSN